MGKAPVVFSGSNGVCKSNDGANGGCGFDPIPHQLPFALSDCEQLTYHGITRILIPILLFHDSKNTPHLDDRIHLAKY